MTRKRKPFTMIDNDILMDEGVSIYEKMVYAVLCCYADKEGLCYPSYKTIAAKAGCSPRKAFDAIQKLEMSGLLEKQTQQTPKGSYGNNLYKIVPFAQDARGIAPHAKPIAPPASGGIAQDANKQEPYKQKPYNKNQSINLSMQ